MSGVISSETVSFPAGAAKIYGEDARTMVPFLSPVSPAIFSQALAAVTTLTLFAATAQKRTRILRIIFNVDAGGPYLFTFGGIGTWNTRITPPFYITLEFGPGGMDCIANQAVTIRNTHATIAGNIDLIIIGGLYDN